MILPRFVAQTYKKIKNQTIITITAYKRNKDLVNIFAWEVRARHGHQWNLELTVKSTIPLTDEKIRYRQIQKVVIALSSQTLVHFKGQNDKRVAQNYYNHQSYHHRHQQHKHGSGKRRAALDSGCDIGQIVGAGVGVDFFLRHGLQILNRGAQNLKEATGAQRLDLASDNPETLWKRRSPAPAVHKCFAKSRRESAQRSP